MSPNISAVVLSVMAAGFTPGPSPERTGMADATSTPVAIVTQLASVPRGKLPRMAKDGSPSPAPVPQAEPDMDPVLSQAIGCLIAGSLATGATIAAGSENVVAVLVGGRVVADNAITFSTALLGVVFGTFCGVGQALTPIYLHLIKGPSPEPAVAYRTTSLQDPRPSPASLVRESEAVLEDDDLGVPMSWRRKSPQAR